MNTKVLSNENQDRPGAAGAAAGSAAASKPLPADALIVIPMRNTVLFPGVITPITVGRASSVAAAQEAVRSERKVGFALQRDPQKNDVRPEDLYWVGTAGQVVRYITAPKGRTTSWCRASRASACSSSSRAGRSWWRGSRW